MLKQTCIDVSTPFSILLISEDIPFSAALIHQLQEVSKEYVRIFFGKNDSVLNDFGEKTSFDAVLVDLSVEPLKKHRLLEKIAEILPNALLFAMGQTPSEASLQKILECGVHDFFVKDLSFASFMLEEIQKVYALQKEQLYKSLLGGKQSRCVDPVTGLVSGLLLSQRMYHVFYTAKKNNVGLAVLVVKLKEWRLLSKKRGQRYGNAVIRDLGSNIQALCSKTDIVCRFGVEELVVVLTQLRCEEDSARIADLIIESEKNCVLHIGIALFPRDGEEIEVLLKFAAKAVLDLKERQKHTYLFYAEYLNKKSDVYLKVIKSFPAAIRHQEFKVYFQPRVDYQQKKILACEGEVYWEHPELGLLEPLQFMPYARDCGFSCTLYRWLLEEVFALFSKDPLYRKKDIHFSVKFPIEEVMEAYFLTELERLAHQHRIPEQYIIIELTGLILPEQQKKIEEVLDTLSDRGYRLSFRDYFGTLPFQELKISTAFKQEALVKAGVAFARHLSIPVVVEGVETLEEAKKMVALGCTHMQGPLFSPPISKVFLKELVENAPWDLLRMHQYLSQKK